MTVQLVDATHYARWTGDTTNAGAELAEALMDAQQQADQLCNRVFAYGQYKETLYIYQDGKIYPSATPLVSVDNPSGQSSIQGVGVWVGWWDPYPILANTYSSFVGGYPPQTTITYTGGYQPYGTSTGPTPPIPGKVARVIAQLAWKTLHPVELPDVPAGVNSVHVGDVGFSGPKPLTPGAMVDPAVEAGLADYVVRRVRAWQTNATPVS